MPAEIQHARGLDSMSWTSIVAAEPPERRRLGGRAPRPAALRAIDRRRATLRRPSTLGRECRRDATTTRASATPGPARIAAARGGPARRTHRAPPAGTRRSSFAPRRRWLRATLAPEPVAPEPVPPTA